MRSAERLTRPKALAALRPAGPPPTIMTSYVGNGLSGIVRIGEVVARWNKRPVTRIDLANPIAVSSLLSPVFVGYILFRATGSYVDLLCANWWYWDTLSMYPSNKGTHEAIQGEDILARIGSSKLTLRICSCVLLQLRQQEYTFDFQRPLCSFSICLGQIMHNLAPGLRGKIHHCSSREYIQMRNLPGRSGKSRLSSHSRGLACHLPPMKG